MTDDAWSRFPNSPVGEGWVWYVSRVETEVAMSWLLIEAKRWGHGGLLSLFLFTFEIFHSRSFLLI